MSYCFNIGRPVSKNSKRRRWLYIIPPKELIDDVLDDNFTDWIELMNKIDMDNAIIEAESDLYDAGIPD